ncbi:uncharacterized protein LOC125668046 isoform X3 [Ostrea edulis]|uniref:uncharacterized protein LOC130046366 isoform X2 n=1 Tax=Ostrea edulis TaxID=37623 RepID=UPI002095C49D|nr:uncharacterized protein LOC130046366 isoform X2 [Ostrea edulis]XP_056003230.1 uncharacterized protein LOC130046333 isoform X3 [Ostrea edulis]XP_056007034.1 uncharacterized protein LOC125648128 isoform X2 [Ostrea edulis]XP_056017996.1 uncharacterized protein LOC125668046 isoform X3 [Ostrea edulis]
MCIRIYVYYNLCVLERVEEGGKHQDSLLLSGKMSKHDEKMRRMMHFQGKCSSMMRNCAIVSLTEANVEDDACSVKDPDYEPDHCSDSDSDSLIEENQDDLPDSFRKVTS